MEEKHITACFLTLYRNQLPTFFPSPSVCLVLDVHPDHHSDRLHEPERHRVPGHALHPEGLRHHLPPGTERPEEEAQLQSRGAGGHRVHSPVPEDQRQTERGV